MNKEEQKQQIIDIMKADEELGLYDNKPLELRSVIEPNTISFSITQDNQPKEIIRITEGTFYWKGEEVKDTHQVYERFNEWLTAAEALVGTNSSKVY